MGPTKISEFAFGQVFGDFERKGRREAWSVSGFLAGASGWDAEVLAKKQAVCSAAHVWCCDANFSGWWALV